MGMRGKCEFPKMKHILDNGSIIFITAFKTGSSDSVTLTHTRSGSKTLSEMTRSFAKQCFYNFHYETEPQQCAHTCGSLFWGGSRSLSILPRKGLRKGVLSLNFKVDVFRQKPWRELSVKLTFKTSWWLHIGLIITLFFGGDTIELLMFKCWCKKLSKLLNLHKMTVDATDSMGSDWT